MGNAFGVGIVGDQAHLWTGIVRDISVSGTSDASSDLHIGRFGSNLRTRCGLRKRHFPRIGVHSGGEHQ
ncbi:hypothetical protein D3C71_1864450 [compost metagenome]